MQIKFRYTDLEYHRLRKLNYLVGLPKWKTYGMVFLCLLPSLLLVLVTQSWIAILSASCLMFCLIAVGLVSAIREKKIVDQHDRVMTLTPFSTHVLTSHTQAESRWDYFDEFWETADEFWFKRLERHSMIPKRAVEESEFEEIRSYGNKANSSTTNETENDLELDQGEPVSVYQRFFSQGKGEIYQFRYNADDLTKFVSDPLKLIDTSERWASNQDEPTQPKGRQNFFGCFWLIVFVTLLVYTLLSTSSAELRKYFDQHWLDRDRHCVALYPATDRQSVYSRSGKQIQTSSSDSHQSNATVKRRMGNRKSKELPVFRLARHRVAVSKQVLFWIPNRCRLDPSRSQENFC